VNEGLKFVIFDSKQNNEQLTSTLTSLRECYEAVDKARNKEGANFESSDEIYVSENQSEFKAYLILNTISLKFDAMQHYINLEKSIASTPHIKTAMKVMRAV
jgi:lipopolysaccharide biosynthesis regulator YciM